MLHNNQNKFMHFKSEGPLAIDFWRDIKKYLSKEARLDQTMQCIKRQWYV